VAAQPESAAWLEANRGVRSGCASLPGVCCGGLVTRGRPPRPLAERFWALVSRKGPDECWVWLGSINQTTGVPRFKVMREGRQVCHAASRIAYWLHTGVEPAFDARVVHTCCGGMLCCNPAHLEAQLPSQAARAVRRRAERQRYREKLRASQSVNKRAHGDAVDLGKPKQCGEPRVEFTGLQPLVMGEADV
jgi:hypothetical protein